MTLRFKLFAAVTVTVAFYSSSLLAGETAKFPKKGKLDVLASLFQQKGSAVSCELKVKEKYDFYDIDGVTVSELRQQMRQNGTKWNDGKVYAALTTWDIRYNYDVIYEDGRCSVRSARTDVDIVYHLPRRTSPSVSSELARLWDSYLANLREHEFGHKDLAVKTAAEINEVLASLGSFESKDELEQEVNRRAAEKLRRLKEVQVEYDDDTRHGETQGAVLPYQ